MIGAETFVGAAVWMTATGGEVHPPLAYEIEHRRLLRYANPDELRALWSSAGLSDVAVAALDVEAAYDDFDALWTPFLAGIGPAGSYAASLDADAQAAIRERFRAELGDPVGPFTLTARAWSVRGTK